MVNGLLGDVAISTPNLIFDPLDVLIDLYLVRSNYPKESKSLTNPSRYNSNSV
jgi:hypothetical protein